AIEGDQSVTSLSCDDDGEPVQAKLILPVAPEGDVAWPVGEAVTLKSYRFDDLVIEDREFQLRGSDEQLWAAGSVVNGSFPSATFLPLVVGLTEACGDGDGVSYQLDIELEGQSL